MSSPDNLFEVVDRRGYFVVCSKSQWDNHISIIHPEIKDDPEAVIDAIESPDYIYQSNEHENRDVYFKKVESTVDEHIKVIVQISSNFGEVVTAFPKEGVKGNINVEVCKYVNPQL